MVEELVRHYGHNGGQNFTVATVLEWLKEGRILSILTYDTLQR